jgi:hypothetical protein
MSGPVTKPFIGAVAQLVERLLCKQNVRSSNLLSSTITESVIIKVASGRACSSVG